MKSMYHVSVSNSINETINYVILASTIDEAEALAKKMFVNKWMGKPAKVVSKPYK